MNPPLRSRADTRGAALAGLQDGTIEVIATDHAPHTAAEKARRAWPGSAHGRRGVGMRLRGAQYGGSCGRGIITFARAGGGGWPSRRAGSLLASAAAAIAAGRAGRPDGRWTLERAGVRSIPDRLPARWGAAPPSPEWTVRGEVMLTLVGGREAYRNGDLKR